MKSLGISTFKRYAQAFGLLIAVVFAQPAASQSGPRLINISGGLFQPNGSAILNNNVTFKIEIRDKAGSCVLYSEIHSGQDLSTTKGAFSLLLGAGSSPQNFLSGTAALDAAVFKNPGVIAPFTGCASGVTFAAGDERVIRVYYDTGSGLTAMTPDVPVVSSAYAMVAETLQGKGADEFAQLQGTAAGNLNQANLEYSYSLTNWQRLKDLIDGVSSQYLPTAGTGTFDFGSRRITGVTAPGTSAYDVINKGYADAYIGGKSTDLTSVGAGFGGGQTLVWDQAQNKWVTGTAADATKLPLAGGTMSGDITMAGNDLFSVGDIIMNTQKRLQLGRYTAAEQTTLVGTLGTGSAGMTWFNTTTGMLMVWNGTSASSAGMSGSAGGDLTGSYPNPSIAAGAVATAKIADNAITAAKIKTTGVAINRLIATDPVTPNNLTYFECGTVDQIIAWTASGWACTTVSALSPVKTVAGKTPNAAGNVALSAYDITGIESAATKDYGTAAGELVELDGTGKIPSSLLPGGLGTITSVVATAPLQGGGTSGAVTVSIDVGTGANQVVRLNGSAQIPAVDGSLVTNVNATKLATRNVSSAAPGGSQVLGWNSSLSQWEPMSTAVGSVTSVVSGTGLVAGTITSMGTINVDVGTGANKVVQFNGSAQYPGNDGSLITNVNATKIATRTVSSTAPTAAQVLAWNNSLSQWEPSTAATGSVTSVVSGTGLVAGTITSSGTINIDVGTGANKILQLNGSAQIPAVDGSLLTNVNASKIGTHAVSSASPTTNYVLTWNGSQWEAASASSSLSWPLAANPGTTPASAPSYSFNGDTDTGFYSSADGQVSIATNGTARLTVKPGGFVGIGTTSPQRGLSMVNDNVSDSMDDLEIQTFSASNTPALLLSRARGTAAAPGATQAGDGLGSVVAFAHTGSGWVNGGTLGFSAETTYSGTTSTRNSYSYWSTVSGGTLTERVRVDSQGRVGIGTTSPTAILDVASTGTNSAIIVPRDTTANRPSGNVANGMVRYNTNLNVFEFYQGGAWTSYTTGSGSGGDFYKDGSVAMTGAFRSAAGTVGAPGIAFSADTDTGLYLPGAGTASFATNGTARLTITAAGNVGIGTTNPWAKLEIVDTDKDIYARVLNRDSSVNRYPTLGVLNYTGAAADGYPVLQLTNSGGTEALSAPIVNNNSLGKLQFSGGTNASWGTAVGAVIEAKADENFTASATGTYLTLSTTPVGSTGVAERVRVAANGNVGIGVIAPSVALAVASTGTNSAILVPRDTTANRPSGNVANGMIRYNTNTNAFEFYQAGAWTTYTTGSGSGGDFYKDGSVAMTGAFRALNGTVGAPGVTFSGDTDTGLFLAGPGTAALAINGTSRFTLDGTTLDVNGDVNAGWFRSSNVAILRVVSSTTQLRATNNRGIEYVVNGNASASHVMDANGNTGLGTTSPVAALDITATGTNSALIVPRDTTANRPSGNVANGMIRYNTNTNKFEFFENNAWVNYGTGTSGGSGSISFPLAASPKGTAGAPAYSFSGDTDTGLFSSGAGTASFATNGTTRMTIDDTGNIGIGTSTPLAPLALHATAGSNTQIKLSDDDVAHGMTSITQTNVFARLRSIDGAKGGSSLEGYSSDGLSSAWYALGVIGSNTPTSTVPVIMLNAQKKDSGGTYQTVLDDNDTALQIASGSTKFVTVMGSGNVGIGTVTPGDAVLNLTATGTNNSAIVVPRSTTATRPNTAVNGMIRYNTNTNKFEFFENNAWVNYGTGSSGGGGSVSFPLLASPATTPSSAVSYSFSGDGNTGMHALAADTLALTTAGTARFMIDSLGRIGVGTTSPSADVHFYKSDNSAETLLIENANPAGVLGDAELTLKTRSTNVSLGANDDSNAVYLVNESNAKLVFWADMANNRLAIGDTQSPVTTLDIRGSGNGYTAGSNFLIHASNNTSAAMIGLYNAENTAVYGATAVNGTASVAFITQNSTSAERMRIDYNGRVGIGTTTPASILDISATGTNSAILVPRDTTANRPSGNAANGMIRYNTNTNKFEFFQNNAWVNYGTGASGGDFMANGSVPMTASLLAFGGSTAAPGISFAADTNTGLANYANDSIEMITGGVSRVTLTNSSFASAVMMQGTDFRASNNGTATNPAYTYTNDTDTGMYLVGPGTTAIATNGTARMAIAPSGAVGFGANFTNPTADVHVKSNDAYLALQDADSGTASMGLNAYIRGLASDGNLTWEIGDASASNNDLKLLGRYGVGIFANNSTTASLFAATNGNVGVGSSTPVTALEVAATGTNSAILVPRDTTANRPSGNAANGMIRYNTNTNKFEFFENNAWVNYGTGSSGGSATFPLLASPIGSAGAPAYAFSGDSDTGFYSAGAGTASFATNGTARMTLDAVGNLGVGTAAPTAGVHVVTTGSRDGLRVDSAGGSMVLDQYGILTSSYGIRHASMLGNFQPMGVASNNYSRLLIGSQVNYNLGTNLYDVTSGAQYDRAAIEFKNGGTIAFYSDNVDRTASPTLSMAAWDALTKMVIRPNGNVGIGTTTPVALLELATTGTNSAILVPRDTTANRPSGNAANGMIRYNTNTNKFEFFENNAWVNYGTGSSGGGGSVSFPLLASPATSTTAAVTYSFTGDANTGMHTLAADTLALTTNGTVGLTINNIGNVGLGTTSPTGRLDLFYPYDSGDMSVMLRTGSTSGSNARSIFKFREAASSYGYGMDFGYDNSTDNLFINTVDPGTAPTKFVMQRTNGWIGIGEIGNTQPQDFLHIVSNQNDGGLLVEGNGVDSANVNFRKSRGSYSAKTAVQANDEVWNLLGESWTPAGNWGWSSGILSFIEGNPTGGTAPASIEFWTTSAENGSWGSRMKLASTGQLAIGTTNPTAGTILDLAGSGTARSSLLIPRDTTANRPGTGVSGMMRYNTTTNKFEGYEAGVWKDMISSTGSFPLLASPATTPASAVSYSFNGDANTGMHTTAADTLQLVTAGTARLIAYPAGHVRMPSSMSTGSSVISSGTANIDFDTANTIRTDFNCGSTVNLANLRDGGTYTLIITGTGTTQCTFNTSVTGADAATVNYRFRPSNSTRTASSYTVYTFLRSGSEVLVSWTSGF